MFITTGSAEWCGYVIGLVKLEKGNALSKDQTSIPNVFNVGTGFAYTKFMAGLLT